MKTLFKTLVFASFILVAVFSFAAMGGDGGRCIASVVQGAACPTNNLFGFAHFHLGFFKSFSSVFFETLAALILLLAFAAALVFSKFSKEALFKKAVASGSASSGFHPAPPDKIRKWLSLFESSPNLVLALR